eukprot:59820-Chlamydomonas_euryale.AAC.1
MEGGGEEGKPRGLRLVQELPLAHVVAAYRTGGCGGSVGEGGQGEGGKPKGTDGSAPAHVSHGGSAITLEEGSPVLQRVWGKRAAQSSRGCGGRGQGVWPPHPPVFALAAPPHAPRGGETLTPKERAGAGGALPSLRPPTPHM